MLKNADILPGLNSDWAHVMIFNLRFITYFLSTHTHAHSHSHTDLYTPPKSEIFLLLRRPEAGFFCAVRTQEHWPGERVN